MCLRARVRPGSKMAWGYLGVGFLSGACHGVLGDLVASHKETPGSDATRGLPERATRFELATLSLGSAGDP